MPSPIFKPGDLVLVFPIYPSDPIRGLGKVLGVDESGNYKVTLDVPAATWSGPGAIFWVHSTWIIPSLSQEILNAFPDLQTR